MLAASRRHASTRDAIARSTGSLFKLRSSRGRGCPSECSAGRIAEKLFRMPVAALYYVRPSLKILPNPLKDGQSIDRPYIFGDLLIFCRVVACPIDYETVQRMSFLFQF